MASASDWPVTLPPDPLDAMQIGVTRRFPGHSLVDEPLWPEEACTTEQMIDSFTINAARALFVEAQTGSIEPGKSADVVVVDRDLSTVSPAEIGEARVLLTLFQGRRSFATPRCEAASDHSQRQGQRPWTPLRATQRSVDCAEKVFRPNTARAPLSDAQVGLAAR